MMATEQPIAHTEEQQHYDDGEMGEGEEEVSVQIIITILNELLSAWSFASKP